MRMIAALFFLLFTSACVSEPLEKAFDGKLEPKESNAVISEYCVSCHLHSEFDAEAHVFEVKYKYENKRYAGKTECNICHTYKRTIMFDIRRGTHWPVEDDE